MEDLEVEHTHRHSGGDPELPARGGGGAGAGGQDQVPDGHRHRGLELRHQPVDPYHHHGYVMELSTSVRKDFTVPGSEKDPTRALSLIIVESTYSHFHNSIRNLNMVNKHEIETDIR